MADTVADSPNLALLWDTSQNPEPASKVAASSYRSAVWRCPNGHSFSLPFSEEADIPLHWECRCNATAELRDGVFPEVAAVKPPRSHWDMLRERRSLDDLEELLAERLDLLRATTTRPGRRKSA